MSNILCKGVVKALQTKDGLIVLDQNRVNIGTIYYCYKNTAATAKLTTGDIPHIKEMIQVFPSCALFPTELLDFYDLTEEDLIYIVQTYKGETIKLNPNKE
jgi:hypothetical protein